MATLRKSFSGVSEITKGPFLADYFWRRISGAQSPMKLSCQRLLNTMTTFSFQFERFPIDRSIRVSVVSTARYVQCSYYLNLTKSP
jgi:hypothetical protein